MTNKKIIISGATGFLGSNLVKAFIDSGHQVIAIVRAGSNIRRISNLARNKQLEMLLTEDLGKKISVGQIGAIIHTATNYGRHKESLSEIAEVNVELPKQLLKLAREYGVKYFINTDTFLPEDLPANDKYYNYVQTKKEFLSAAKNILKDGLVKFINARIYQMYGPDDNPDKFLPWIINTLFLNQLCIALSPGKQARDFIYISDVVSAFARILESAEEFENFEDFEVGTGKATDLKNVVENLKILTASKSELQWGKRGYEPGEIMISRAPIENNRKVFWQPKVSLKEGLEQTVKYYKPR